MSTELRKFYFNYATLPPFKHTFAIFCFTLLNCFSPYNIISGFIAAAPENGI